MKLPYEEESPKGLIATGSSKPLVISKININKSRQMANQKLPLFSDCSNSMMTDSDKVLPLKKGKLKTKFRNVSHEQIIDNINKINRSKERPQLKLK